jgi:hypothetical protein
MRNKKTKELKEKGYTLQPLNERIQSRLHQIRKHISRIY